MCTVSWSIRPRGYSVHFNRDEQKSRALAEPPRTFSSDGVLVCMPIDPVGGGSWCSVNEFGFSLSLLNFYQGRTPKGRLLSRGKIVKNCAKYRSSSQVFEYLQSINLSKYAPFSLLCFSLEDSSVVNNMLRWNGRELRDLDQASPLISSAVNYDTVFDSRISVYRKIVKEAERNCDKKLFKFHSSHLPSRSSLSICMHRDDAHTVSYSRLTVGDGDVEFHYSDGSPCEKTPLLYSRFKLRQ